MTTCVVGDRVLAERLAPVTTQCDPEVEGLVYVADLGATVDRSLVDTPEAEWAAAEDAIWQAFEAFQAAYQDLLAAGGAIVAVVPSIAVTGAAGFVPAAAAGEGIRQLAKSAARAWGHRRRAREQRHAADRGLGARPRQRSAGSEPVGALAAR